MGVILDLILMCRIYSYTRYVAQREFILLNDSLHTVFHSSKHFHVRIMQFSMMLSC